MFFNKQDLFKSKISLYPLSKLFQDYQGDDTVADSLEFIKDQFKQRFRGKEGSYHVFVTCSLDFDELDGALEKIRQLMITKQDTRFFTYVKCF